MEIKHLFKRINRRITERIVGQRQKPVDYILIPVPDYQLVKIRAKSKAVKPRKPLTNTEKFFAMRCKLDEGLKWNFDEHSWEWVKGNKTTSQIRAKIMRLRNHKDYNIYREVEAFFREKPRNFLEMSEFFEDNWYKARILTNLDTNIARFVSAENEIAGLSEDEIEKLAILEAV